MFVFHVEPHSEFQIVSYNINIKIEVFRFVNENILCANNEKNNNLWSNCIFFIYTVYTVQATTPQRYIVTI